MDNVAVDMSVQRVVVVVPGFGGREETWEGLLSRLKAESELTATAWHFVDLRLRMTTRRSAQSIAEAVLAAVNQAWIAAGRPREIWLIGASIGGLAVRRAYLDAVSSEQHADLAAAVDRIILFAGVNRGVNVVNPRGAWWWVLRLLGWLWRVAPWARGFAAADILRGSPFVTNLRLEWIRQFAKPDFKRPAVVQFLPENDWLVKKDDSRDLEQFPESFQVDVPGARHDDAHRVEKAQNPEQRYALLKHYILNPRLSQPQLTASPQIADYVLAVHGIRASNRDWATHLCDAIRQLDPTVKAIAIDYGYFSAWQFALPFTRRKHLRRVLDTYAECLADSPSARFHYVGHSNGTFLLGEGLKEVPGFKFGHVVLVGSVLPTTFDWRAPLKAGQVGAVWNHRSNKDWPVALLCSALRGLGLGSGIGTAGYEGFSASAGYVTEHYFYEGGHGEPLKRSNLAVLARQVLGRSSTQMTFPVTGREYFRYRRAPSYMPRLAQLGAAVVIGGTAYLASTNPEPLGFAMGVAAVAASVVLLLDLI